MPQTPTERLAINALDIETLLPPEMVHKLLVGRINLNRSEAVRLGHDDLAVEFTCPLLTAATVCDLIRSWNRREGDSTVRVYLNRGKGWVKLSPNVVLTLAEGEPGLHPESSGEGIRLNPDLFPSTVELAPLVAPSVPVKKVF